MRYRLPLCPKEYKPSEHIQVIRRGATSSALHRYVSLGRQVLLLQSNKGSLKPMASALRAWGSFCDALGAAHFPISGEVTSRFAIIYREPGALVQYVSHLRSACLVLGHPVDWHADHRIKKVTDGIQKSGLVFKTPRLGVAREMMARLAPPCQNATPERFFCVLSWVFMPRAQSETSVLHRAGGGRELARPLPPAQSARIHRASQGIPRDTAQK